MAVAPLYFQNIPDVGGQDADAGMATTDIHGNIRFVIDRNRTAVENGTEYAYVSMSITPADALRLARYLTDNALRRLTGSTD